MPPWLIIPPDAFRLGMQGGDGIFVFDGAYSRISITRILVAERV